MQSIWNAAICWIWMKIVERVLRNWFALMSWMRRVKWSRLTRKFLRIGLIPRSMLGVIYVLIANKLLILPLFLTIIASSIWLLLEEPRSISWGWRSWLRTVLIHLIRSLRIENVRLRIFAWVVKHILAIGKSSLGNWLISERIWNKEMIVLRRRNVLRNKFMMILRVEGCGWSLGLLSTVWFWSLAVHHWVIQGAIFSRLHF